MVATRHPDVPSPRLSSAGLIVLVLGAFDWGLEGAMIVPALPDFATYYDASLIATAWLATAYVLVSVVAAPLLSRLGDLYGKRRLLLLALAGFTVGSLVSALADSIEVAIAGRAVQGVGAAVGPLTFALVRDTVPPHRLSRVIGTMLGAILAGSGIGFLLGGILADAFSPAAIFWFLFLFGLALMLAIPTVVPESPLRTKVALDPAGILVLAAGLVALLLAISKGPSWGWGSTTVLGLFAAAAVLFASFVVIESHVRNPYIDLRLITTWPFASVNACAFAYGFASLIGTYVVPQMVSAPKASGYGLTLSTTEIGLLLLPSSFAGVVSAYAAGRWIDRGGPRTVVAAGASILIVGNLLLAAAHDSTLQIAAGLAVIGLSWGLMGTGFYTVTLSNASADKSAIAVSVPSLLRSIGVSLGVTASFVVIASTGFDEDFRNQDGYTNALLLGAAGACIALLAALTLPGRRKAPPA